MYLIDPPQLHWWR